MASTKASSSVKKSIPAKKPICLVPKDIGMFPSSIHTLFQRDNFRNCAIATPDLNWSNEPEKLTTRSRIKKPHYKRMIPALQLASRLLDKARPFYAKILGSLRFDEGHHFDYDYDPNNSHLEGNNKKVKLTTITLDNLAKVLRIFRSDNKEEDKVSRAVCVNMAPLFLDAEKSKIFKCPERPAVAIILNSEIYEFFTRPDKVWKETPKFTKQMYCFELAVTLVHELAHAMWILRSLSSQNLLDTMAQPSVRRFEGKELSGLLHTGIGRRSSPFPGWERQPEPRCSREDPEPELGWACEEFVLGMITWGPYWHMEEKKCGEKVVLRRVGKPVMYLAPWILVDAMGSAVEEDDLEEEGGSEQPEGISSKVAQVAGKEGWERFVERYPAKCVSVDEKYLDKVFKKRRMR